MRIFIDNEFPFLTNINQGFEKTICPCTRMSKLQPPFYSSYPVNCFQPTKELMTSHPFSFVEKFQGWMTWKVTQLYKVRSQLDWNISFFIALKTCVDLGSDYLLLLGSDRQVCNLNHNRFVTNLCHIARAYGQSHVVFPIYSFEVGFLWRTWTQR